MFVNPGRKRRSKMKVVRRGKRPLFGAAAKAWKRKRAKRRNPAHPVLSAAKKTYAPVKKARKTRRKRRKLYGAAAAAHAAKMGRKTPSTKKRRRRRRKATTTGAMTMAKAKKKRRSKKRRKSAAPKKTRRRKKRKSTSRKRRRSKSSKRSRAARKAARTRAAKKAKRRAAAKKAARSRKRKGGGKRRRRSRKASSAPRKRRRSRSRRKSRKGRKGRRRRTGVKALKRARRSIRYQRRRGGRAAKAYMKRYRMRSNPGIKGILGALKKAVPYGVGFFGSRLLVGKLGSVPVVGGLFAKLGSHAAPVAAVGAVALAAYSHKIPVLGKFAGRHRDALVTGAALNAIATVVASYLPSVAGFLGMGEYVSIGEYVRSGEYFEQGDYVQELGEYYSDAAGADFYGEMGADGPLGAVGREAGLIGATDVPALTAAEPFSVGNLYQGIFAEGN